MRLKNIEKIESDSCFRMITFFGGISQISDEILTLNFFAFNFCAREKDKK